jgi:hypothetical protein
MTDKAPVEGSSLHKGPKGNPRAKLARLKELVEARKRAQDGLRPNEGDPGNCIQRAR